MRITGAEYGFCVHTVPVFAFDHNEEIHASGLCDLHTKKISTSIAKKPEDLLIPLLCGFLLG